jgi:hypothetical protein
MTKEKLSDVEIRDGDEQSRDSMLLKLLKTPPKPRPKRQKKDAPTAKVVNKKRQAQTKT